MSPPSSLLLLSLLVPRFKLALTYLEHPSGRLVCEKGLGGVDLGSCRGVEIALDGEQYGETVSLFGFRVGRVERGPKNSEIDRCFGPGF